MNVLLTKNSRFKQAVRAVIITNEQSQSWTVLEELREIRARLLDDKKMMSSSNEYSFSERTLMSSIRFFELALIVVADNKDATISMQLLNCVNRCASQISKG